MNGKKPLWNTSTETQFCSAVNTLPDLVWDAVTKVHLVQLV
jgi:hypothetical protein